MIRLKEARFKTFIPKLTKTGAGGVVRDAHAEMWFVPEDDVVLVRVRAAPNDEFIVPFGNAEYATPAEALEGVFADAPISLPEKLMEKAKDQLAAVVTEPEKPQVDDTVRMVKINGKVVERKGPPKPDELKAIDEAKGKKTVAQMIAEHSGESDDE